MKEQITQEKNIKPHIVVVTAYFYPEIGGVQNYAYFLAKELIESGEYRVSIITTSHESKIYKEEMLGGMKVHRLPITFKISNTPINLMWNSQVRRIFTEDKPDLIHLHSPVPYLPDIAAMVAGEIPVVLTYHAGSMIKHKLPQDILIGIYEDVFLPLLFKRADAIVALSQEFTKRKFPQFVKKMYFIPTGIDLDRFKKTQLPNNTERITFVGRVEHSSSWKGIGDLLRAMVSVLKQRPEAVLEIVGGGDAVEHYRTYSRELGIEESVIFSGSQLGKDLVDAYERSNVVVLSSISEAEAFSVILVEAMAMGRPIIGTNIGGTSQVIENGKNGLLVPPENPEELAEAIIKVLSDKKLAQELADNGALRAQNFSWNIQAKKYGDLFRDVLTKGREQLP